MVISRVSTYTLTQGTLRDATRTQNTLFDLQRQVSSGLKADTFEQLSGQVEYFTALDNKMQRTKQFTETNKVMVTRLQTMQTALDQVSDTADDLKNLILMRRNALTGNNLAFEQQLDAYWQSLTVALNTHVEGRYLFSGTDTAQQAVDDTHFPELATDGVPDDGYYLGSKQDPSLRVSESFTLTSPYIRADDPGIQKLFAALAVAKEASAGGGDDLKLQQAFNLASEGIQGVIDAQAKVNSSIVTINKETDKLGALQLYWKGLKDNIANTDIVGASTEIATNQGILQATFQVFARINSLRLSDFLR